MAKKKKSSRKKTSRRRVSGVGGDIMQLLAGIAVGAVGSKMGGDQLAINAPDIKPNMVIAGKAILGVFGSMKLKNPLFKGIALGVTAEAAVSAAQSFGVINGIGSTNLVTFRANPSISGMDDSIAGYDMDVIAGTGM